MPLRLLYILFFVFLCNSAAAQPFKYVSYYLQHPAISEDAIDFYTGKINITDRDKLLGVLDSLFTSNDDTRPFYIFLTSKMLNVAKGELRKDLNVICRHFAEQHSSDLAGFLFTKHYMVLENYKKQWAYKIAVDIRLMCNKPLMACFKESRNIAISNCDELYSGKMEVLYNYVRRELNLFQQR